MKILFLSRMPAGGMAIFPFILIRKNVSKNYLPVLINHERIHLRQQLELLIIPFYLLYLLSYLLNLLRYRKHKIAYRNILFEREAFDHESEADYLKKRKFWAFLDYLK